LGANRLGYEESSNQISREEAPLTRTLSPQGRGNKNEEAVAPTEEILTLPSHSQPGTPHPRGCGSLRDSIYLSPGEVFRQDRADFFPMLTRDAKGLVNWRDMAVLGGSLAGSIVVREELDDEVRDYTRD